MSKRTIQAARETAELLGSVGENIRSLLHAKDAPLYAESVRQLADGGHWGELVNRNYKRSEFGTGGIRGRVIGDIVTAAEQGRSKPGERPEFPCAGTNSINYFNISRAAQGLVAHCHAWHREKRIRTRPLIVIAHDTRYFSRELAGLTARVAVELGCDAALFDGPRSTPECSFVVRTLGATAGVVITASHNPSHDNGFKCYFTDGAQVVEPHASGIISRVNALSSDIYKPLPKPQRGRLTKLGAEMDRAYMARLETLVLDRAMIKAASRLKIVFTPIHGTGGVISKPMLKSLGFRFTTVPEQDRFDGAFPTVASPNPENAEALDLAIKLARKEHADVVIATDPDCDRMGVAVRNASGGLQLLTGNQIGSLIAAYRVRKLVEQGVITPQNSARCAIIKTLVTTDLLKAIASRHGLRCVETLTGFKYIGEKLGRYENQVTRAVKVDYRRASEAETRELRLRHSTYYVAGGEESYGYSAHDFVRDKDGNASVVMFAEVCAWAKSRGLTVDRLLDEVYAEYGYYVEKNGTLSFPGADGAAKIKTLATSYAKNPPTKIDGSRVVRSRDFKTRIELDDHGKRVPPGRKDAFHDVEGAQLPRERSQRLSSTCSPGAIRRARASRSGSWRKPGRKPQLHSTICGSGSRGM
jgi:phosphoglucomutase